ncbi:thioredoxin domain-containing protein-like isoform X3 [Acropora palmata]|uniref:thioredoxin domain-containing protein-like isoform X3 n=1 Tax=Acropora palmata TaxID=6131 RepID=UPI003DA0095F
MAERMSFCYICAFILLFESCFGDNSVKILNDESFEHLTQASTGATTGDWFIVFSFTDKDPECTECKKADEAIAKAQEKLSHKLNFALVLPPKSKLTLKRFDVARWPHVILLKQGKQYTYSEGKMDEESFIKFIEKGYELAASQPVPPPISKLVTAEKNNTKVMTPTDHNRRKQYGEPIRIPCNYWYRAQSVVKNCACK